MSSKKRLQKSRTIFTKSYGVVSEHGKRHIKRRPYLLPIAGFLLGLAIVGATVFAHGGRPVQVNDSHIVYLFDNGGKQQTLDAKSKTVGELVNKLDLHLIPQDVVEPSLDTPIVEDNFRVNVYRARPVTVTDDKGTKTVAVTAQKSARVVAQEAGLNIFAEDSATFAKKVKIGSKDQIQPSLNTPLTPNIQIFVSRLGTQIQTVEEEVPSPTQIVPDGTLSLGASATRQSGSPGKRAVTYQIETKNGQVGVKTVIQTVIIQEPVPTIIARGTRVLVTGDKTTWMAAAGISSGDYGYVNYVISHESGWNPASLNSSGCAGLGQACPGSKLANACPGWQNDPVCQLRFFSGYASRYGGWGGSYNFWLSHHYW
jgi:uncharacterized protein YabE (DUF348 family)